MDLSFSIEISGNGLSWRKARVETGYFPLEEREKLAIDLNNLHALSKILKFFSVSKS